MAFIARKIPKHLILEDPYSRRRNASKRSRLWLAASLSLLFGSMLIASVARAEVPGAGELRTSSGERAVLLGTQIEAELSGLVANVRYTQLFLNQGDQWQEAVYSFPLPENAAVYHMEIQVGERRIVGEIKEKAEARKVYQEARKAGKRAALTEQQRPNMFTQSVANIAPGEHVEVTLLYQHTVWYRDGQFEWRLPTTYTPRYIPGVPLKLNGEDNEQITESGFGWAVPTTEVADADWITPPMTSDRGQQQFTVALTLDAGLPLSHIDALFHEVQIQKDQGQHRIELAKQRESMNRDFVLQWATTPEATPQAAIFHEQIDGEDYALIMVLPPQRAEAHTLPRDVVFVIDTSGSMGGESIAQARQSLHFAIDQLDDDDRFNVIAFDSQPRALFNSLQGADSHTRTLASEWVAQLQANGGTEMASALALAFDQFGGERLQQLVFITDGAVGNERALFRQIQDELGSTRLFTVGIGSAPNSHFMRRAADFGRGSYHFIGDLAEVGTVMQNLFNRLEHAVSTNIELTLPADAVSYPSKPGDLYLGEPLLVSAKMRNLPDSFSVKGQLAGQAWQQRVRTDSARSHGGIARLWARAEIEDLEAQQISGLLSESQTRDAILDTALRHNLMSRFTSFVAVEDTPVRPHHQSLARRAVHNVVAKGQTAPWPQTATSAELGWWLGLFALMVAIVVKSMSRDE